jgi:endonuclease YncB( thermonuclease family)
VRVEPRRKGARRRVNSRRRDAIGVFITLALVLVFGWEPISQWAIGRLSAATRPGLDATAETISASLPLCMRVSDQSNCVLDGDTLRYRGETIRLADIDAPEVFSYDCAAEKALGERATRRLQELVNAGPFAINRYYRDADAYGRSLRILTRDGQSIGKMLVGEGLARDWDGVRHPWC